MVSTVAANHHPNPQHQQEVIQLHKQLIDRETEIEMITATLAEIGRELDLTRIYELVARRARELIHAETVLIPVIDPGQDTYTYRGGFGKNAAEIIGQSLPMDCGICGWVWRHNRAWWRGTLSELSDEERNRWEKEAGSVILVPLKGRHGTLGGIAGINKLSDRDFDRRDLNLLNIFASVVAVTIDNAMAIDKLEHSQHTMEQYQQRLEILNRQLTESTRELENLSLYDPVTELPNRSLAQDRLIQHISIARDHQLSFSVLLFDVDHFKQINDTLGHENGDLLLKMLAQRFSEQLFSDETFSRLGGDEFMLILPRQNGKQALRRARKLLKLLEQPFHINGNDITIGASVGISVFPDHGDDPSTLMRFADIAMYNAKQNKLGMVLYNADDDSSSLGQLTMTTDLRRALEEEQFKLYFQPKISFKDGRIYSAEALGRWNHPQNGPIPPSIFIQLLEQNALINQYTEWVIHQALKQISTWQARGHDLKLAINISTQTLSHDQFLHFLLATIPASGLGEKLIFEITESLFLAEFDNLSKTLNLIRDLGITLSIDDFGTGYSSLSRLKKLPVKELKIDRSFILDMAHNMDDQVIVKSTIDLAHNLDLFVVAEGAENEDVVNHLRELGCDAVQGYFIGRPVPIDEFDKLLERQKEKA